MMYDWMKFVINNRVEDIVGLQAALAGDHLRREVSLGAAEMADLRGVCSALLMEVMRAREAVKPGRVDAGKDTMQGANARVADIVVYPASSRWFVDVGMAKLSLSTGDTVPRGSTRRTVTLANGDMFLIGDRINTDRDVRAVLRQQALDKLTDEEKDALLSPDPPTSDYSRGGDGPDKPR